MFRFPVRFRRRRGTTLLVTATGLTMALVTVGLQIDSAHLYAARHKDQVVADAACMAAAQKLPYREGASSAANLIVRMYRQLYNSDLAVEITFFPAGSNSPTQVRVRVSEAVPMIFPALMGSQTRGTGAIASASRVVPQTLLQGAVPLGIQYDDPRFNLPAGQNAGALVELKLGPGDAPPQPGNYMALSFVEETGANAFRQYLKYGYSNPLHVGDIIQTKPGNMRGPVDDALINDLDSRLTRSQQYPFLDDTYSAFDNGNPRAVVIPLINWISTHGGRSTIEIKGFAVFFMDAYLGDGRISGRFIRFTRSTGATDVGTVAQIDGGLYFPTMIE